ncbi:MAG: iron export ABC transporter permease subunit FetB [Woeseiaceae bacterium]
MNVISLTALDLSLAAITILLLALLSFVLKLDLASKLIIAAVRTVLQLFLIGLVLKILFAKVDLLYVTGLSLFMLLIAGREVMSRQQRRFGGWWGYGLGTVSMFVSSFALTVYALIVVVGTDPWYTPQYAIPLLGMMLGNTMTGVSLALDKLTTTAWQQRAVIETRLALGQDWKTAIGNIKRDSIRVGMIPMINAMAAAGLVSLPGMMTGQILSGTDPLEAVKYQILIMFLITAGTGFATIFATWVGAKHLFDDRQRLHLERLTT